MAVPGHDAAFAPYAAELEKRGASAAPILASASHADFLGRHLDAVVEGRHLPREWPPALAALVPKLSLADLWRAAAAPPLLLDGAMPDIAAGEAPQALAAVPFMAFVADWHRLRKGRELARDYIRPERLAVYEVLARRYAGRAFPEGALQAYVASLMRIYTAYLGGLPSRDFAIDLATGAVTPA
jgi:hypothetical protein